MSMKKSILYILISILAISCKEVHKQSVDELRLKVENISWEENPTAEGCKISVAYPIGKDALSENIRQWINESLGGTYSDSLNDGNKVITYYGEKRVREVEEYLKQFNESPSINGSCWYLQIKKNYETMQLVSYTSEVYEYAGGAHGSESLIGAMFRKSDGRRFGWDIFTEQGKEKLRQIISDELKNKYFKAKSDEDFYEMLFNVNAQSEFPLPQTNPIFKRNGILFIYQQYEIAPYAAGMPQCEIPYDKVINLCTVTVKPLIESTTDSLATTLPYGLAK